MSRILPNIIKSTAGTINGRAARQRTISVIVPVYNEIESIIPIKIKLNEALRNLELEYEIIFIDDGSTDGAKELLDRHKIEFISHPVNKGYGAAIKTGASASKSDYLCIIDCDLTYPPKEIPNLLKYAEQYAMVVGARKLNIEPLLYRIAKRIVCNVLKSLYKQEVPDINSGLRVFNAEVFREYMPALCDRFSLTSSITLGFLLDGRQIKYVPIEYYKRAGKSKIRCFSYLRMFLKSFIRMYRFHLHKKGK